MASRVQPQISVAPIVQQPMPQQPAAMNQATTNQTTVVVQQSNQSEEKSQQRDWTTGLCGCCDDMGICLFGCLLPWCLLLKLVVDMGESPTVTCCVPEPLIPMRAAWRNRHNIKGSIQDDCCAVTFCFGCTLCQLAQDMKHVNGH